MTLAEWAQQYGVPPDALRALCADVFNLMPPAPPRGSGQSEAEVQARTRLAVSQRGDRVWRNNSGAGVLDSGSFVRFGLANDSEQLNKKLKSSDLIGIENGTGRFLSYECKPEGWRYTGTPREQAQLHWITLIAAMGGIAKFITAPEQI